MAGEAQAGAGAAGGAPGPAGGFQVGVGSAGPALNCLQREPAGLIRGRAPSGLRECPGWVPQSPWVGASER